MKLEICVDSYESLQNAIAHGADRVELCSALSLGGLSPSPGTLSLAAKHYRDKVFVMVRPRAGDFLYTEAEFEVMLEEIELIRKLGFPGIVTGILDAEGRVDMHRMERIVSAARPMEITFHRAFDNGCNASDMMKSLIKLGIDRVLTSGMEESALAGAALIRKLRAEYGEQIMVMPGAGITAENLDELIRATGCREYHMSAKLLLPSGMCYTKDKLPIPHEPLWFNDGADIARAAEILKLHSTSADVTTTNPRANIGMNPEANPNTASVSSRSPHSLPLPYAPFYDPEFAPMILMVKAYRNLLKEHRAHSHFTFSVTRNGIPVETVRLEIMEHHEQTRVYVERILKTYLWILGGNGLILDGPKHLVVHIAEQYSPQGKRNFDVQFFSEVFGRAFEITEGAPDSHPDTQPRQCEDRISARESLPQSLRSKTANVRIGIDLGGSTLKITVLKDNQVLHRAGYAWTPKVQSHPDYHYREITSAVRKALELTQINPNEVASIGISSAGIVLDNAVITSSLFRAVPENLKEEVRVLFERVSREFGNIPYQIVNDGEIAALAGKTAERSEAILGLTLGTSLGCGYIDTDGKLTNQINELAFVPLDISDSAIIDEWSGDRGVGVSYLSQDAAIKLAANAGLFLPGETPSQQFQYLAQLLTTEPGTKTDEKPGTKLEPEQGRRQKIAERIFDDMGIYLGYAIAYYREFYAFRHLLLLGGVVAGRHGERIVQSAKQVLSREFPDIAENVEFVSVEHASHIQDFVAAQIDQ